jgi:hypothetical protein
MVVCHVVERPRDGNKLPYNWILEVSCGVLMNGDRAGSLGESGGASVGKGGESDVESQHLQGCSPCMCQLRIYGLVPVNKY